jgi:Ser/Thr protein kinase RdoA (MazF antagonist)
MDGLTFDAPALTPVEARRVARDLYGVDGVARRVRGERSHNTVITTADGRGFVLKIAGASEPDALLDLETRAMQHVAERAPGLPVARMIAALDGSFVPTLVHAGSRHRVRLVTYLPGVPFRDDQVISPAGLTAIGALLGAIAAALADFDHDAADDFMPWDIANGLALDDELWAGAGDDARSALERARPRLERAATTMHHLPRQIIHNDGHGGNLLRADATSDLVTGIIDFGDVVRTVTAADVGVSGANLVPHQADPIAALVALTLGYHSQRPLSDVEIAAVPDLVLTRLALSTLLVDHQIANTPHIAAEVAAERPGLLAGLASWTDVDPTVAADSIAAAALGSDPG